MFTCQTWRRRTSRHWSTWSEAVRRARAIGEEIADRGPLAVRAVKTLVDDALDRPLAEGHEAEIETSVRIFATDDLLEGARSFVEKRPPEYHGR